MGSGDVAKQNIHAENTEKLKAVHWMHLREEHRGLGKSRKTKQR